VPTSRLHARAAAAAAAAVTVKRSVSAADDRQMSRGEGRRRNE